MTKAVIKDIHLQLTLNTLNNQGRQIRTLKQAISQVLVPKKVKAIQDMSTELRVIVTQDFEKNYGKCKKKQNHATCIK